MKRLFLGFPLAEEVAEKIKPVLEKLEQTGADLKLVSVANLHLTVKFLGEVADEKVEEVKEKAAALAREEKPFRVKLTQVGAFPSLDKINVVWIGVESREMPGMMRKANRLLNYLREEARTEVPHLTIARVKSGKNKEKLQTVLEKAKNEDFGEMEVDRIVLYASNLTPQGPAYTFLEEFVLK